MLPELKLSLQAAYCVDRLGQEGLDNTGWVGLRSAAAPRSVRKSTALPKPSPEVSNGGPGPASAPPSRASEQLQGYTFSTHHIHSASAPELRLLLLKAAGTGPGLSPDQAGVISAGQGRTQGTHRASQGRWGRVAPVYKE